MTNNTIANRLNELRQLMQEIGADYYYVPATDPHKDEFVPSCWQRRQWISGFTGSAGDVLVGRNQAYLWTDARYFLQAEYQLDDSLYQLMRQGQVPPMEKWLTQQNKKIAFATDPRLINNQQANDLQQMLSKQGGKLLTTEDNLVDRIWADQDQLPENPIHVHDIKYAGVSTKEKLTALRQTMHEQHADAHVVSALDSIAWLFNIRGTDIAYTPIAVSYAIVTADSASLFIDPEKVTPEVAAHLQKNGIDHQPYQAVKTALGQLTGTVWLDPKYGSLWITEQLNQNTNVLTRPSPIILSKAIKNKVEQQGMCDAHVIDAVAVIQFLHWLDHHWQDGVTELSAAKQLDAFRREEPRCVDSSFATISGFAEHGAVIHYLASEETNKTIDDSNLFLVDSGGHYYNGSTDITRTVHLGTPSTAQKHHYTLVLKGHLALGHAVFPQGSCGEHINALAHQYLWQEALDYNHGTGHGVGSYLCLHEGPQVIAKRNSNIPLHPGMVVSNEPGVYLAGEYGIRIENLCLINEKFTPDDSLTDNYSFYGFEDLTLVPYCRKLINTAELSEQEIQWINDYHHRVNTTIGPLLPCDELRQWLNDATKPL